MATEKRSIFITFTRSVLKVLILALCVIWLFPTQRAGAMKLVQYADQKSFYLPLSTPDIASNKMCMYRAYSYQHMDGVFKLTNHFRSDMDLRPDMGSIREDASLRDMYLYFIGDLAADTSYKDLGTLFKSDGKYSMKYSDNPQYCQVIFYGTTYYYTMDTYTVTFTYSGAVPAGVPSVPSVSKAEQSIVTLPTTPKVPGYTFSGWSAPSVRVTDNTFTMPSTGVDFTGTWLPKTDTTYKVEFYKKDSL